ncbi:hypothetical protein RBI14_23860 [Alcaligenaceae bacterium B3P038]|nr:hypothetical protein [Alcaligenaceae bacterium B3P038]
MSIRQLEQSGEVATLRRGGEVLLVGPWYCFQGVTRRATITNADDLRRALYPYLGDDASRSALARMYSRIMCTQSVAWQNSAEGVANHIGAMAQGGAIAAIVLPDLSGESDPRVSAVASTEMQQRAGPVSRWPLSARFAYVLENAPSHMSSAAAQEFRKLLSPEAIGTMVAVLVVWAASHAVGVGVAIDAVLVAVGFALAGWAIFDALGSLYDFIMLTKNAERIDDLDRAARALADGVAHLGVGVVVALLTRGAGRLTRGSAEASPRRLSTREDVPSRGQGGGGPPNPRRGTLSDQEAREWYLRQEADIPSRLDRTQPIESQARQAFDLRNQARTEARELMADRVKAAELMRKEPNMTWQQITEKYAARGHTGDDLYRAIIGSSQRSRASVNNALGVDPSKL